MRSAAYHREQQSTLLVTGASRHPGRRVLELLLEADTGPIIATTRAPDDLADFAQPESAWQVAEAE